MPDISIYNKCNNRCLMCTNPDIFSSKGKKGFSLTSLGRKIERFYNGENEFLNNFKESFCLSGGEPTLSEHLNPIIEKIRAFFPGIRIYLLTNGRIFNYQGFAREFLASNENLDLIVPIHGYNAEIHDRITQTKDSFQQTVNGLKNILRFKSSRQTVEIRVVIHNLNFRFLKEIAEFIRKEFLGLDRLVYVFFEIEGQACKNLDKLRISYTQLRPFIEEAYDMIKGFKETRFYHFPLCTLSQKFYPFVWRTLPEYEVDFIKSCQKCKVKKLCLGIHRGYLKYMGSSDFRPINNRLRIIESHNWQHPIKRVLC